MRTQLLEAIGALTDQEALTSLGRHLAALPLPPALGKLLLYGVLFGVLDPVLTVACCMSYRCGLCVRRECCVGIWACGFAVRGAGPCAHRGLLHVLQVRFVCPLAPSRLLTSP